MLCVVRCRECVWIAIGFFVFVDHVRACALRWHWFGWDVWKGNRIIKPNKQINWVCVICMRSSSRPPKSTMIARTTHMFGMHAHIMSTLIVWIYICVIIEHDCDLIDVRDPYNISLPPFSDKVSCFVWYRSRNNSTAKKKHSSDFSHELRMKISSIIMHWFNGNLIPMLCIAYMCFNRCAVVASYISTHRSARKQC